MKKSMFLLPAMLVSLAIASLSCNDKNDPTVQVATSKESGIDHLRMYFEGLHPFDQVRVFNALPAQTKHDLFVNHWENQINLSKDQGEKDFLRSLISHLKPEYYRDSALFQKEAAAWFRQQTDVALKTYKNDSARVGLVLFSVGGNPKATVLANDPNLDDCTCNITSSWCIGFGYCQSVGCEVFPTGCGGGGLWSCNGKCAL